MEICRRVASYFATLSLLFKHFSFYNYQLGRKKKQARAKGKETMDFFRLALMSFLLRFAYSPLSFNQERLLDGWMDGWMMIHDFPLKGTQNTAVRN